MGDLLLPLAAAMFFGAFLSHQKASKEFARTRLPTLELNFATGFLLVSGISSVALWIFLPILP